MRISSRLHGYILMFLVCCAGSSLAQSPDQEQNLFACKNGWDSCNHSILTETQKSDVVAARHEQNIADCKDAWASCDRSTLSAAELADVSASVRLNIMADCWDGLGSCDYSKLTEPEATAVAAADKQRNISTWERMAILRDVEADRVRA